jgi:hypothetical protein
MTIYDENLFVDREKKLGGFQKLLKSETRQYVKLIRAQEKMGKSWLVSKMRLYCAQPDAGFPAVLLDFRHPREMLQLQTCLGLIRLSRDKLNAPAYFQALNETINQVTAAPAGGSVARLKPLADKVDRYFSEPELRQLAVALDVDPENLPHATKFDMAFGLVRYHDQRGVLPRLLAKLGEVRPQLNVNWGEGLDLAAPPAGAAGAVEDRNQLLLVADEVTRREAERQINDAFFRALVALMADRHPIVFLLDSYEDATDEVRQWVEKELLLRLRDGQINDVVAIVTGRETPDLDALGMDQLVVKTELEPFDEQYVQQYLERRRISPDSGLDVRTVVLTSGGIPGILALMIDNVLAKSQKDDPFFNDV